MTGPPGGTQSQMGPCAIQVLVFVISHKYFVFHPVAGAVVRIYVCILHRLINI